MSTYLRIWLLLDPSLLPAICTDMLHDTLPHSLYLKEIIFSVSYDTIFFYEISTPILTKTLQAPHFENGGTWYRKRFRVISVKKCDCWELLVNYAYLSTKTLQQLQSFLAYSRTNPFSNDAIVMTKFSMENYPSIWLLGATSAFNLCSDECRHAYTRKFAIATRPFSLVSYSTISFVKMEP